MVVAAPEDHAQTYATAYNPAFSGEMRVPVDRIAPLPLDERKVIARRCAFELPLGGVVNLGIGMPEAWRPWRPRKLLDLVTLTAEPGIVGGLPQGGLDFGAAINPGAIIDQNQQFDFYDGGGLDLASGWRRRTGTATSMSAASATASPEPVASSTSRRTPAS